MAICVIGDDEAFSPSGSTLTGYVLDVAQLVAKFDRNLRCVALPSADAEKQRTVFASLRSLGIQCVVSPMPGLRPVKGLHGEAVRPSYLAYEYLKQQSDIDVVHFIGESSMAFYYLEAKRLGLIDHPAHGVVHVVTPLLYRLMTGARRITSYADLAICHMERRAAEMADEVIVQSETVKDWMVRVGYKIDPDRTKIAPGLVGVPRITSFGFAARDSAIDRLVFAGRLNNLKGLTTLVYALNALGPTDPKPKSVLFAGAEDPDFVAVPFIQEASTKWPFKVEIETALERRRFLAEIKKPGTLVLVPSAVDERPLVVQECVALGVPFIAFDVGEIRSLVPPSLADVLLCPPHHQDLAARLRRVIGQPLRLDWPKEARLTDNEAAWKHLLGSLTAKPPSTKTPDQHPASPAIGKGLPAVSVCVAHYNRPKEVTLELESILAQSCKDFEVIVVDDGSSPENVALLREILQRFPRAELVCQENRYLGAARNTGARAARGEYLLFKDDDNIAKPNEIETFLGAAERNGSNILVCFSDNFTGDEGVTTQSLTGVRRMAIGQDLTYGLFRNGYGDSNCFVRRSVWQDLGGFTEHYRIGLDDHEFFTRATLRGYDIDIIPEALYYYRTGAPKMKRFHIARHANFNRIVTPYVAEAGLDPKWLPVIFAARGFYEQLDN